MTRHGAVMAGAALLGAAFWTVVPEDTRDGTGGPGRIRCGEAIDYAPFVLTLADAQWFDASSGALKRSHVGDTCSAVRIGLGRAATARHCLCNHALGKAEALVIGHVAVIDENTQGDRFEPVTGKALHGGGCEAGGADIAVLAFADDLLPGGMFTRDTYREIGTAVPGAPAFVYGTGQTTSDGAAPCGREGLPARGDGHRLKAARTVIDPRASNASMLRLKASEGTEGPVKRAGYVCDGDSGAPVIQRVGAHDHLVGIARAGTKRCNKTVTVVEGVDMEATPATLAESLLP